MKSEESKDIEVTFPEDYHAQELKGQPVTFKVTVHEIKKKVLPELNDEFVEDLKYDDVHTVDELKDYTKKQLQERKQENAKKDAEEKLIDELSEITEVNIPEVMIKSEIDSMVQNYQMNFMQQGLALEQFLQMTGQSMETFRDGLKEDAEKRIKVNLALSEIAKLENIEVSDDEVNDEYQKMADTYSMSVDDIKLYVSDADIKSDLKIQKTLDSLKK